MKIFEIYGKVKHGNRLFTAYKMVLADSSDNALAQYLEEFPLAKMITMCYKGEIK